jgi:hypothetical protein
MHSKVSSDFLPSYIKATWPVLEIFNMSRYFLDSLRISKWFCTHSSLRASYSTQGMEFRCQLKGIGRPYYIIPLHSWLTSLKFIPYSHIDIPANVFRHWLQAVWGLHDSVETRSSVIICKIIVCICWFIVQNTGVTGQGIDYRLSEDDTIVSKHVAVW